MTNSLVVSPIQQSVLGKVICLSLHTRRAPHIFTHKQPMSGFQRKEFLRTPRSSHASTRHTSRSSSRVSSRWQSDDEDDYMSNNYLSSHADALVDTLDNLLLDDDENEVASKDKFSEGVEMLSMDRRNSSLEAREKALADIISVISKKYEPEKISHHLVTILAKAYMTSRSETETLLSVQALCICAAVDTALVQEMVDGHILTKLLASLGEITDASTTARANLAVGYSLLQFLLNYGGGGFKLEETIEALLETAQNCGEAESSIASAAILGAGLITACHPNPNSLVEEFLPWVNGFLSSHSTSIKLAAGKLIGLYYQLYDYGDEPVEAEDPSQAADEDDPIPDVDQRELEEQLRQIIADSSKKVARRQKKERKSLFRDVLSTVEQFASPGRRSNIRPEDLQITHMKLSRSKSLSIDSWAQLILLQHLKWAYGFSIHTQMANNPMVREAFEGLRYLDSSRSFSPGYTYSDEGSTTDLPGGALSGLARSVAHAQEKEAHARDEEKRAKMIRAKRQEKLLQKESLVEESF